MKFFKYGLALVLIAAVALSVVGCSNSKEPLAATVNGKKITIAEVDKRLGQVTGQNSEMLNGEQGQQLKEQFRQRILDQLIDMELLLTEADKQGIKITDKDVDAKIKEIMETYSFKDKAAFEEALKQQNLTKTEFKLELEKSLRIEKLGEKLTKDIKISNKDVEGYYNKNKAEFMVKDQVHVAHILVQKEEDIKKIAQEIKNGGDFAALAKKNSIDPGSKDNGGELPWTDNDKFVPEFGAASWALEPGQISEPVKTTYGFHIIKLLGKKPAGQKTLAESKDEIKEKLDAEKKREFFTKWLDDLKKKSEIKKYIAEAPAQPATDSSGVAPQGAAPQGAVPGGAEPGQAAPEQGSQPAKP